MESLATIEVSMEIGSGHYTALRSAGLNSQSRFEVSLDTNTVRYASDAGMLKVIERMKGSDEGRDEDASPKIS
jgi:hypothetical protein